ASGFVPASGPSCVENVCGGSVPANASASVGGTQAVGTDWHYAASAGTCTFACDADHSWDGSACRPDCTGPRAGLAYDYHGGYAGQYALSSVPALVHGASASFSGTAAFGASPANGELTATFAYSSSDGTLTKDSSTNGSGSCASANYTWNGSWSAPACAGDSVPNQACTTPPTGAVANTAATITQTWSGATLVPSLTSVYSETSSSTECFYKCNEATGYHWDGNSCVNTCVFDDPSSKFDFCTFGS
ncbi:MAG: hypothetical protein QG650_721, partial [Patescibacteria group bacterium]|nr:hypothetical protein [Patescibacteria group bacterium]